MLQQPIPAQPSIDASARRLFTLAYNEMWISRGTPWMVRAYGHGHWCVADGEPAYFAGEDAAHAHGRRWIETGEAA